MSAIFIDMYTSLDDVSRRFERFTLKTVYILTRTFLLLIRLLRISSFRCFLGKKNNFFRAIQRESYSRTFISFPLRIELSYRAGRIKTRKTSSTYFFLTDWRTRLPRRLRTTTHTFASRDRQTTVGNVVDDVCFNQKTENMGAVQRVTC